MLSQQYTHFSGEKISFNNTLSLFEEQVHQPLSGVQDGQDNLGEEARDPGEVAGHRGGECGQGNQRTERGSGGLSDQCENNRELTSEV